MEETDHSFIQQCAEQSGAPMPGLSRPSIPEHLSFCTVLLDINHPIGQCSLDSFLA